MSENFKNESSSAVVIEKEVMLNIKNPIIVIEITLAMDVLSSFSEVASEKMAEFL